MVLAVDTCGGTRRGARTGVSRVLLMIPHPEENILAPSQCTDPLLHDENRTADDLHLAELEVLEDALGVRTLADALASATLARLQHHRVANPVSLTNRILCRCAARFFEQLVEVRVMLRIGGDQSVAGPGDATGVWDLKMAKKLYVRVLLSTSLWIWKLAAPAVVQNHLLRKL